MANHGNLDDEVEQVQRLRRDSGPLVAEDQRRAVPRCRQVGEPHRFLRELDTHDRCTGIPLTLNPLEWVASRPVNTGRAAQRVAAGQRLRHPRQPGYRKAGADGVTGSEQGALVGPVLGPQRRHDQVVPARVPARAALRGEVLARTDPDLRLVHRAGETWPLAAEKLKQFMVIGASRRAVAIVGEGQPSRDRSCPFTRA